jgi:uncharacterized protein (DUF983 family)
MKTVCPKCGEEFMYRGSLEGGRVICTSCLGIEEEWHEYNRGDRDYDDDDEGDDDDD